MMQGRATAVQCVDAVEAALLAVSSPDRSSLAPPNPLPRGAIDLIRVAADDREHAKEVARRFGVDVRVIEDAALHFVHAAMFHQDSDHFRVLGVRPDDDEDTLKLHFRWLQKWLHPDRDPEGWTSVYSERVNVAWAQLRRPDRRALYRESLLSIDRGLLSDQIVVGGSAFARDEVPLASLVRAQVISSRWARRLPAVLVGVVVVAAVGVFAAHRAGENMIAEERARAQFSGKSDPSGTDEARNEFSSALVPRAPATNQDPGLSPSLADQSPNIATATAPAGSTEASRVVPIAGLDMPQQAVSTRTDASSAMTPGGVPDPRRLAHGTGEPAAQREIPQSRPQSATAIIAPADLGSMALAGATQTRPADIVHGQSSRELLSDLREPQTLEADSAQSSAEAPVPAGTTLVRGGEYVAVVSTPAAVVASTTDIGSSPTVEAKSTHSPRNADVLVTEGEAFDPMVGRRLLNEFSTAYRDGQVQRLVVLFAPNARTPEGNLLELHRRYGDLFGESSKRSLEFVDVQWRQLANGLEGTGRFEWARRSRTMSATESSSGPMRIVIEFVDGQPLISLLEHQDVG